MKTSELIGVEIPWRFTKRNGHAHLSDKAGFDAFLNAEIADGEYGYIVVVPLTPSGFHAAAFRYYWNCLLPLIAEAMGEPNLEEAHDAIARQFLPVVPAKPRMKTVRQRRGKKLTFKRKSTAMESMPCEQFCAFLDRLIAWATVTLGLSLPMADRAWKWKRQQKALAKAS